MRTDITLRIDYGPMKFIRDMAVPPVLTEAEVNRVVRKLEAVLKKAERRANTRTGGTVQR